MTSLQPLPSGNCGRGVAIRMLATWLVGLSLGLAPAAGGVGVSGTGESLCPGAAGPSSPQLIAHFLDRALPDIGRDAMPALVAEIQEALRILGADIGIEEELDLRLRGGVGVGGLRPDSGHTEGGVVTVRRSETRAGWPSARCNPGRSVSS